jgi:hypothetical protein
MQLKQFTIINYLYKLFSNTVDSEFAKIYNITHQINNISIIYYLNSSLI